MEENQRLEMIIHGGRTFYIPISEGANINGFAKWEQTFRVYANIYTKENPQRSSEMIEYNHVIHTISSTYVWDNVYQYDKEFRMHMAERSWAIILQQAWSLRLKDKLHITGENRSTSGGSPHNRSNEPCRKYNRGKCQFGSGCRYDHKCSYCFKFGHTILTCRKLKADMDRGVNRGGNNFSR